MMWDFSGGASRQRPKSPAPSNIFLDTPPPFPAPFRRPSQSSDAPAPFMPLGAPSAHTSQSSSQWEATYHTHHHSTSTIPRGPVIAVTTHTTHHVHHSSHHYSSSHHVERHSVPRSHVDLPQPQKLSDQVARPPLTQTRTHSSSSQPAARTLGILGHHPHFQYSKCTGRRKALCIGVNYTGQSHPLRGCVNDAKNVRRFLMSHCRYKAADIRVLVDDAADAREQPTRQNILDAMHWLVRGARAHDALFFHYSGHGGQIKDRNGDEVDGMDEVIFPVDHKRTGIIVDDLMHTIMVKSLPAGCRLTALFDSCHSGSVLDLPYLYHSDGREKGSQVTPAHIAEKSTPADVISWSGCTDAQTSADTFKDGSAVGAMSSAFISSLRANPDQSYQQLLRSLRSILKARYSQTPQLSSSHRIDTNLKFIM